MRTDCDSQSDVDRAFMQKALDLARSAMDEKQDFPIAALLVVDDNIVAGAEVVKSFETPAGIVY